MASDTALAADDAAVAAGAMMTVAPVDAAERQPGVLYDSAGKELGTLTVTDAPKGVCVRSKTWTLSPRLAAA